MGERTITMGAICELAGGGTVFMTVLGFPDMFSLGFQDHMVREETRNLTPKQCAVLDLALDTIKVETFPFSRQSPQAH